MSKKDALFGEIDTTDMAEKIRREMALRYVDQASVLEHVSAQLPAEAQDAPLDLARAHIIVATSLLGEPLSPSEYLELTKRIEIQDDKTITYRILDD